jgi:hypothetical protein
MRLRWYQLAEVMALLPKTPKRETGLQQAERRIAVETLDRLQLRTMMRRVPMLEPVLTRSTRPASVRSQVPIPAGSSLLLVPVPVPDSPLLPVLPSHPVCESSARTAAARCSPARTVRASIRSGSSMPT